MASNLNRDMHDKQGDKQYDASHNSAAGINLITSFKTKCKPKATKER